MQSTLKPIRIAFGHKARTGKDTAVDYISNKYGCVVLRFAEPVYNIATDVQETFAGTMNIVDMHYRIFLHIAKHTNWASVHTREIREAVRDWISTKLFPRIIKEGGPGDKGSKVPWLLQMIGTDLRQVIGSDVWTNIVKEQIVQILENRPDINICLPDMRFPNEFEMLRELGFTLVNVTRKSRPIDRDPKHPSEIALDGYTYDYVIANDRTIPDYRNEVCTIIKAKFEHADG